MENSLAQVLEANLSTKPSVYGVCKVSPWKILSPAGKDLAVHLDDQRLFSFLTFREQKPKNVIIFFRQQFRWLIKRSDNQTKPVGLDKFFRKKCFRFIEIPHLQLLKKQIAKNFYRMLIRGWRPNIMCRPALPAEYTLVNYYGFRSHIDTPILYRISRLLSKF